MNSQVSRHRTRKNERGASIVNLFLFVLIGAMLFGGLYLAYASTMGPTNGLNSQLKVSVR